MSKRNGERNSAKGRRYSLAEKNAVLKHVETVNLERGRGGISAAAEQFGVSPLTISNWLHSEGVSSRSQGSHPPVEIFYRMAEVQEQIMKAEGELARYEREYAKLKSEL